MKSSGQGNANEAHAVGSLNHKEERTPDKTPTESKRQISRSGSGDSEALRRSRGEAKKLCTLAQQLGAVSFKRYDI